MYIASFSLRKIEDVAIELFKHVLSTTLLWITPPLSEVAFSTPLLIGLSA
ncbi:MAG: hypothetical protein ACE5GD_07690 [Candidatus Geothermarchaeales archaeon]